MIKDEKDIHGYRIDATDGELGEVDEFLFKDGDWVVRYLVVDTHKWLAGGQSVLISPIAIQEVKHDDKSISVALTKEEVKNRPGVESVKTVSRKEEVKLNQHFGWGSYWLMAEAQENLETGSHHGRKPWGGFKLPGFLHGRLSEQHSARSADDASEEPHFRATSEVRRYNVNALDGYIGYIKSFLLDDQTWEIHYIVVDTNVLEPGKKILMTPDWIKGINWNDHEVSVQLEKATIKQGPAYDPDQPLPNDIDEKLYHAYGKLPYQRE